MGITYETLQDANKIIKQTPIHGKQYAEVNQRIKAFRFLLPNGFIETDMIFNENGICVFRAACGFYEEDGSKRTLGEGHAFERQDSSMINKTSYIENCETSAVGRALGMAGFGIDTALASAEEMQNALAQQGKEQPKNEPKQKDTPKEKEPQKSADDLTDAEQAAVATVNAILNGVVDAETATNAIPALQAVKHTDKSRRVARHTMNLHMQSLNLVYDADNQCYVQKQIEEAPV